MRILVVEDDDRVARGLATALRHYGYDVRRVATAEDALAAVEPAGSARSGVSDDATWAVGALTIDMGTRTASRGGQPVPLTRKEFDMLAAPAPA